MLALGTLQVADRDIGEIARQSQRGGDHLDALHLGAVDVAINRGDDRDLLEQLEAGGALELLSQGVWRGPG